MYSAEELAASTRDLLAVRHAAVAEGGREITRLLAASAETLEQQHGSPAWRAYAAHVSSIVLAGMARAVVASCNHLHSQAGGAGPPWPAGRQLAAAVLPPHTLSAASYTARCRLTLMASRGTTAPPCWRCSSSWWPPRWRGRQSWGRQRPAPA